MEKRQHQVLTQEELKKLHGDEYAERFERTHGRRRLLQLIPYMQLNNGQDVVDFGCGNGLLAAEIHSRVQTYTGVDFSAPFIELAVARAASLGATNVRFVHSTIEDFCRQSPERFDVAFAFDFSEHVYDDMWIEIARGIRHTLKPGGTLYVHTPNAGFIVERIKTGQILLKHSPEHVAVRSMADNVRLLESAGFEILNRQFVAHYNVLRFLHALTPLPYFGQFLQARLFITAARRQ
jgi:2-polyprenyl-3-methyl-5-hydroxy-6-metoxy-1,4-benzoquinol methylase